MCLHSFHIICLTLLRSIEIKLQTFVFFFSEMVKRLFVRTFLERTKRAGALLFQAVENAINLCEKEVDHFLNWVHRNSKKSNAIKTIYKIRKLWFVAVCVRAWIQNIYRIQPSKNIWNGIFFHSTFRFENPWSSFGVCVCVFSVPANRSHTTFFTFQCRQWLRPVMVSLLNVYKK